MNFLLQKYVMLCPLMLYTKFQLNRSIFKKKRLEPRLQTRLQTRLPTLILVKHQLISSQQTPFPQDLTGIANKDETRKILRKG